eukprot:3059300-Prorocentrum_lima.AAC.1
MDRLERLQEQLGETRSQQRRRMRREQAARQGRQPAPPSVELTPAERRSGRTHRRKDRRRKQHAADMQAVSEGTDTVVTKRTRSQTPTTYHAQWNASEWGTWKSWHQWSWSA